MPPIKTGVEAFWDNTNFQKGFGEFTRDIATANKATAGTAAPISAMGGAAAGATGSMAGMGAMAVAGGMALIKLAEAAVQVAKDVWGFAQSSVSAAARVQEMTMVMQLLGQRAGYSSSELNSMTQAIRDQGIQTDVALNLMAQFARYNLDMADASGLASVAQNAAVLSMQNSSEALDGLMRGILTYNQETLRTNGININIQKSFADYAATLGKTADALTEQEKAQATLNAVLAAGVSIQGVYDTAQGTAGKQARSLSRYIFDLKAALGAPFLDAFSNVVTGITNFVKALTIAVSEGGRLYPIMLALGTIASFITSAFKGVTNAVVAWLTPIKTADDAWATMARQAGGNAQIMQQAAQATADSIATPFINAAADAITWGANIIINLAAGMIQGAASAITAALNWISALLRKWLAPGSPPKIIPEITKYGAGAMAAYMEGFSQADFSALDAIQASMKSVFQQLVDEGTLASDKMGPMFAKMSKDIIKAMSTGTVDEDLFKKIRESGGSYGKELEQLARDQIALAQAENQVKAAEDALTAAKKAAAVTGKAVNAETRAYNKMLRSGATKEELKAQLAKINAAKKADDVAKAGVTSAENNLDAAKANIDVLKEQAALQANLLQQLLELAKAQLPEPTPPGGDGGGGLPTPPDGGGLGGLGGIEGAIKDAVARIKQEIIDKLKDVWADLVKLWGEKMGPALEALKAAWERFKLAVAPIVDFVKEKWAAFLAWFNEAAPKVLDWVKDKWAAFSLWFSENAPKAVEWVKDKWDKFSTWFQENAPKALEWVKGKWDAFTAWFQENAPKALEWVKGKWDAFTAWFTVNAPKAVEWIIQAWENVKSWFATNIPKLLDKITGWWNKHGANLVLIVKSFFGAIVLALVALGKGLIDGTIKFWENLKKLWARYGGNIRQIASDAWSMIKTIIGNFLKGIGLTIDLFAAAIKGKWGEVWNIFIQMMALAWQNITSILQVAWDIVVLAFTVFLDFLTAYWTKVWNGLKSVAEAISSAITTIVDTLDVWLDTAWQAMVDTADGLWQTLKSVIEDWINQIFEAITTVMDNILEGITGTWKSVKEASIIVWTAIKNVITGLINTWLSWIRNTFTSLSNWFNTTLNNISNTFNTIWTGIVSIVTGLVTTLQSFLETTWTAIRVKAGEIWGAIKDAISAPITAVAGWLVTTWAGIKAAAETAWNNVKNSADTIWSNIKTAISGPVDTVRLWLVTTWGTIKANAESLWGEIKTSAGTAWTKIQDAIATPITTVMNWLGTTWGQIKSKAETAWNNIKGAVSEAAQGIYNKVVEIIGALPGAVAGFVTDMVLAGVSLIQGLIEGAGSMADKLLEAMKKLVEDAIDAIFAALGIPHSPAPALIPLGETMPEGLEEGVRRKASLPKDAMTKVISDMIPKRALTSMWGNSVPSAAPVPVMAGPNYRSMNMTINNNLSNQWDVYALTGLIEKTVIRAMRR